MWNRTNARTFVFFYRAGETQALYYDGTETTLTKTANDGVLFGAFFTMTEWVAGDGHAIKLSISPGEDLDGGQRIPTGVISSINSDGWEIKTPVAGVTACQE